MPSYDKTQLWQKSLSATSDDSNANQRGRLRVAYEKLRERAKPVSEVIARDLPDYTLHDITHLDALWEYADLVVGPNYELTPCEAFVLGGAFLIHDLGMGLAAYPDGIAGLKKRAVWTDKVASVLRKSGQEEITTEDINNADAQAQRKATAEVLRMRHAQRAEELALFAWKSDQGDQFHLIEDPELRASFAPLIGRIAHSHWWPVDQLTREFPAVMGAPGGFPSDWSVDPLRLACILRAADYCHLDDRRAPSFRQAIQQPSKESTPHWQFQSKLNQPHLDGDRLVYTAKSDFLETEAAAWWLCYDTLDGLDNELRKVDSILADTRKDRLAARGVAHAEDPTRLARIIRTDGWYPVDTRIRVTAVANLVAMLGGKQLYGDDITPPLRELMQNGSDAIRARRLLESRGNDWGALKVTLGTDATGQWIEVEDTGVGMSQAILTNCLLDFGTSFWGSPLMHAEFPGLETKSYRAVGRYGIGFFSVFMWGDRVQIVTQRYDAAKADTLVLEFKSGLLDRPLLRKAAATEYLQDAGTRVRVWLKDESILKALLTTSEEDARHSLAEICARISPCLDVSVVAIESEGTPVSALRANDWKVIDEDAFYKRLPLARPWGRRGSAVAEAGPDFRPPLQLITGEDGRLFGRAAIWRPPLDSNRVSSPRGAVVVGGFYASALEGIAGVLLGRSDTAARDVGIPAVPTPVLQKWATAERDRRLSENHEAETLASLAKIFRQLDVDISMFPIARTKNGWATGEHIAEAAGSLDTAYVVQDAAYDIEVKENGAFDLDDGVFVVDMSRLLLLQSRYLHAMRFFPWPPDTKVDGWGGQRFHARTLAGAVIEALAKAWNCSLAAVVQASLFSADQLPHSARIGSRSGLTVLKEHVDIMRRPSN